MLNAKRPEDLACLRTCDEYAYISQAVVVDALQKLFSKAPRVFPDDPHEALWIAGNCQSKQWFATKIEQILNEATKNGK